MRRKRRVEQDSLELFLDTICNTFGGIIFIAILVAILSQTRSLIETPESKQSTKRTPSEIRLLKKQLSDAEAEIEAIALAMGSVPERDLSDEDRDYLTNLTMLAELESRVAELKTGLPDLENRIEELNAASAALAKKLKEVPLRLMALKEEVEDKAGEVSDLIQDRQTLLRLPKESSTSKSSTLTLLKNGRVYLAGEYDGIAGEMDGPHVVTNKGLSGMEVSPRAGSGVLVTSSEVRRFIEQTDRKGKIVTVAVWSDSFETFQKLKPVFLDVGVKYQLWVQVEDTLQLSVTSNPNSRAQ